MAGRPLTGSVTKKGDQYVVSHPERRGSKKRVTRSFDTEDQAERYRSAALSALLDDRPLPDAEGFRTNSRRASRPSQDFASVAWAWWTQRYVQDQVGQPERRDAVRQTIEDRIVPFFAARVSDIDDVVADDVEDFMRHLAGYRLSESAGAPTKPTTARMHTVSEAATFVGVDRSTIRRALQAGKFPNLTREGKGVSAKYLIPTGDLLNAGLCETTEAPMALSKSYAGGILALLRGIFEYARSRKMMSHDPTEGVRPKRPNPKAPSRRPANHKRARAVTLEESKAVAQRLNIHYQLAFWLERLMGLRISEAFGITVDDIYDDDNDEMVIEVWRQGGKLFKQRDVDGNETASHNKDQTKTSAAVRQMPVPAPLAELIRTYCLAFHPAVEFGKSSDSAGPPVRLVKSVRGGGQSGYRSALMRAFAAEGLTHENLGFHVTPHHLRKSLSADLQWSGTVPEHVRSKYLGHQLQAHSGGAAVTAKVYSPDMPHIAALAPAAEAMTRLVSEQLCGLVDPSPFDELLGRWRGGDEAERRRVEEVLNDAGLVCEVEAADGTLVTVVDAAEMIGIHPTTVNKWVRSGRLDERIIRGSEGGDRRMVTLESVEAEVADRGAGTMPAQLAVDLGVSRQTLQKAAAELGVRTQKIEGKGWRVYSAEDTASIRSYFAAAAARAERAVVLAEAAIVIGVSYGVARRLLRLGQLVADGDPSERWVTRESVEAAVAARAGGLPWPVQSPPGFSPIEGVMVRLGIGRMEAMALSRAGVVIRRTADYRFHVEEASLARYLARGVPDPDEPQP
jgi:integrase